MTLPVLWVLNLDAELELQRGWSCLAEGHRPDTLSYATTKPVQHLIASHAERFAALLPNTALVQRGETPLPEQLRGSPGLCWCPTPSALTRLRRAGATATGGAAFDVLIAVNHRRFCADLGQTLPAARFVDNLKDMNALLSQPSATGEWLCKRPLGFAGRGQRRIAASDETRSHVRPDNQRWLSESVPHGGLQIEPHVSILAEFSVHGLLQRDQKFTLGQVCQQHVDEHRAWSHSTTALSYPLSATQLAQLRDEAERVAEALAKAGYFGPFSVDSYIWQHPTGAVQLNPRSEINARMTMAYPIGMGQTWLEDLVTAMGGT